MVPGGTMRLTTSPIVSLLVKTRAMVDSQLSALLVSRSLLAKHLSLTSSYLEWTKKYPTGKLTVAGIPSGWIDALNKAVSSGLIPSNVPVATQSGGGAPTYKNSTGTMNPEKQPICSSSSQCKGDGQIYDVPDGIVAISFDDGPLPVSAGSITLACAKLIKPIFSPP